MSQIPATAQYRQNRIRLLRNLWTAPKKYGPRAHSRWRQRLEIRRRAIPFVVRFSVLKEHNFNSLAGLNASVSGWV
jgi:hypothetical protein